MNLTWTRSCLATCPPVARTEWRAQDLAQASRRLRAVVDTSPGRFQLAVSLVFGSFVHPTFVLFERI